MTPLEFMLYGRKRGQRYGFSFAWITDVGIAGSAAPAHVRHDPRATWPTVPLVPPHSPFARLPCMYAHRMGFGVNVVSMPPYWLVAPQPPPVPPHPYTITPVACVMAHQLVVFRSVSISSGLPAGKQRELPMP